jgi:hypothetical protein
MPDVAGAQARIASLVKWLQRPSGCQDKFQPTDSLSMLAAVCFKIEAPFINSLSLQFSETGLGLV